MMPQSSAGMPTSGGYPDGGNYGLQSAYPSQVPQPGVASGFHQVGCTMACLHTTEVIQ